LNFPLASEFKTSRNLIIQYYKKRPTLTPLLHQFLESCNNEEW
jgi:hypothetical protein